MSDRKQRRKATFRNLLIADAIFLGLVTAEFGAGVLTGYGVLHSGPWWSTVAVFTGLALFGLGSAYVGANTLANQAAAEQFDKTQK